MRKIVGMLGDLEWAIMRLCWKHGNTAARVIYDEISEHRDIKYQTVKTTLDRLVKKKYLKRERMGSIWLYAPVVSEASLTTRAVDDFAHTVLGSTIAPMFIHLLKKKKYSHEIDELKRLIDEIEEEE